ncbi:MULTISPECIES: NERD domain-containing protein [unclassified Clostridioides]|uniref:NERD domain-containing protein n=1 Tax=unclassified Clostridioides TaxID=2635829 RepID=UPI001D12909E|nr:NERD domain-containing protein [Clostridioides sp. ES-S-0049-03]MCC0678519.1 NERD domain-containing protein [Clostridioides sp. ES-W-0018-02]MCC0682489.1 NERD domain-containing protein [Clostridioides sp. ES-S-0005-03]MCC0713344.1 NERD domain-containing protein [Clostridioides sp. ES-W-0017-02]
MFKEIFEKVFMSEEISQTVKEVSNIVKDTEIQVKGGFGELRLDFILSKLDKDYIIIKDIIIPGSNKTTQIDSIAISVYGIFVIECKNFSGYIYGNDKDKVWTQIVGKAKNTFYNPVRQNYAHIKAIENIIGDEYNIYSIIVFSDKATLKNVTINGNNVIVINESEILSTISKYKDMTINREEIKIIRDKIFDCMKAINQNTGEHVRNLKNITEEDKCPRCQKGNLTKRKGQYGEFWGCSEFPKCKYTRK